MKFIRLACLFVLTCILFSCSNQPNDKIAGIVPSTKAIRTPSGIIVMVPDTSVRLSITAGQARHYARQAEHWTWKVVQVLLFLLTIVILYGTITDSNYIPDALKGIGKFFVVGALYIGSLWPIGDVHFNNDNIVVPKSQYDYYMQRDHSTQAIWDSLANACAIHGGPHDCWDKDNKRIK